MYFFSKEAQITNYQQATQCDIAAFKRFFHLMLEQGVYLAPSAYEAGFLSIAHSDDDLAYTIAAAKKAFIQLKA